VKVKGDYMRLDVPYKLVTQIDEELSNEVLSKIDPEHWYLDETRNNMANLEKTQSIILRYFDSYQNAKVSNFRDFFEDKPIFDHYRESIEKVITELKKHYEFTDYMCFFAKLLPNADVGQHEDSSPFLEECHRIHIPLKTSKDVYYIIENTRYNWLKNNIYEFDNQRVHGVENRSREERIHLMFNLYK